MNNVLVTGGAGFVGGHLVRRLLAMHEVESVVTVDNFSSGKKENLPIHYKHSFYELDVNDIAPAMGDEIDTVFHLASNPDIYKAATDPIIDFEKGTVLTQAILEFCRGHGVQRLIYFSGSGVYGECPGLVFDENHGPCLPISTYGASKLAGEAMISAYCAMFGLSAIAFRPANIVGPGQTHGVGFDFMRRLKENPHFLSVLGDGTQTKSYIHIDDIIDAVFLANEKHGVGFDTYNVATDDRISVSQIALMAVDVSGLKDVGVGYTGGDRGWKGDVPDIRLDSTKIRSLGWRPKYGSLESMRLALEAMK
jgi:UDP-glucose 4-epimerase